MTLQAKLDAFKAEFVAGKPPYNAPAPVHALMHRATAELIASGQAERALKAGDVAPVFSLPDAQGNLVSSTELLARGALVVSFYRGVWCPYCNMELQALEQALPAFKARGASLVAISPQSQANSRKSQRQNGLGFPILSDSTTQYRFQWRRDNRRTDSVRGFQLLSIPWFFMTSMSPVNTDLMTEVVRKLDALRALCAGLQVPHQTVRLRQDSPAQDCAHAAGK
ncbi:peroxiredoxin-like family protein [Pseudomonas sp. ABY48]|uniref:peroxiredoxin-like family protein n=1 Tax=Pseudomonas sp. ABY48 TaxID=3402865 RepID=UPI003B42EA9C